MSVWWKAILGVSVLLAVPLFRAAPARGDERPAPEVARAADLRRLAEAAVAAKNVDEGVRRYREAIGLVKAAGTDKALLASLLSDLGTALVGASREAEGLPYLEEAVRVGREIHTQPHADLVSALAQMGFALGALDRDEEALEVRREVLTLARQVWPYDHEELAFAINNLGFGLDALGRTEEAIPLFRETLAMRRRLVPGDSDLVAVATNNLARALGRLGRHDEALEHFREALAMWRRVYPDGHARVALGLGNLAYTLRSVGRTDEALPHLEESVTVLRRLTSGDDAGLAMGLENWAAGLVAAQRAREALPLIEEALGIRRRLVRGDHPSVAETLQRYAEALLDGGRSAEAFAAADESLALRRRLFPRGHRVVAASLDTASLALKALGRRTEALAYAQESLTLRQRLLPQGHLTLAPGLENLAESLRSVGRVAEALVHFRESVDIHRRHFSGDSPELARALANYAFGLRAAGRTSEAYEVGREALAMRRRLYPGGHPALAQSLGNHGSLLLQLGRHEEALEMTTEALEIRRRAHPDGHRDVFNSLNNLSHALGVLGRHAEALPIRREALALAERLHAADHEDVADGHHNLSTTLTALGRLAEALPHSEEAVAIGERIEGFGRHLHQMTLAGLLLRQGRTTDAVDVATRAVEHVEELRGRAASMLPQDRRRYMEAAVPWGDPYAVLAETLVAKGEPALAFEALERGRGRDMLEFLEASRVDPAERAREHARAAGDHEALSRMARVEGERAEAEADLLRRTIERDRAAAQPGVDRATLRRLSEARAAARRRLLDVLAEHRRLLQRGLPGTAPRTAGEIAAMLAPGEYLLAYSLGRSRSHLLVVGAAPAAVQAYELREGAEPVPIARVEEEVERHASSWSGSEALARLLMPPEAWARILPAARVHVIPHGPLDAVPFEALEVRAADGGRAPWLEAGPAVAYIPSGSVLHGLRTRRRHARTAPSLVAVGDPMFGRPPKEVAWPEKGVLVTLVRPEGPGAALGIRVGDVLQTYDGQTVASPGELRERTKASTRTGDAVEVRLLRDGRTVLARALPGSLGIEVALDAPRVAGPRLLERGGVGDLLRAAGERGGRLVALPGSRLEVEAIVGAFRARYGEAAEVTTLLGDQATEDALFRAARAPRHLHIATHGLADESQVDDGSFTGIALSAPSLPAPEDDGFLSLLDLFLRWRDRLVGTELVVLSACDSQRGRRHRLDAPYSLPWGFCFAGAPTVVGSLWKVDDGSTRLLMEDFYRRLLATDGRTPLEALRDAKRDLRRSHPDPAHWAAFILFGDAP